MKDEKRRTKPSDARRRFLGLLGGLGAVGVGFPLLRRRTGPRELDLKEAEFYRRHDLAG